MAQDVSQKFSNEEPSLVSPGLYLGSADHEENQHLLQRLGITHILQVGVELPQTHPHVFVYKSIPLYDLPEADLVGMFPSMFSFLDGALCCGGTVLVHCALGVSRSASVVIGFLMWRHGMDYGSARRLVEAARPIIKPNRGFDLQLRQFDRLGADSSQWKGWSLQHFLDARFGNLVAASS